MEFYYKIGVVVKTTSIGEGTGVTPFPVRSEPLLYWVQCALA